MTLLSAYRTFWSWPMAAVMALLLCFVACVAPEAGSSGVAVSVDARGLHVDWSSVANQVISILASAFLVAPALAWRLGKFLLADRERLDELMRSHAGPEEHELYLRRRSRQ